MDLTRYEELTGTTVASTQRNRVTSAIDRTRYKLEAMLGFTLDPDAVEENLYIESGKTASECTCDVDTGDLLPADTVQGAYRLFRYNAKDRFLHVDPFSALYAVKLVRGDVTLRTFETDEYRAEFGRSGLARFIQAHGTFWPWLCVCGRSCVQLAVDADWLWVDEDDIPNDLASAWASFVTDEVDQKSAIKSQTVGTHSWTKFDRKAPEDDSTNLAILRKYAGPHGSLTKEPVQ